MSESTVHHLTTPLDESAVRAVRAGDVVHLTGIVYGLRDATLRRLFDEGQASPAELRGYPCLHTAPNARRTDQGWTPLCIGTTTSARMERYTEPLLRQYGVPAIIGKGGLGPASTDVMAEVGGLYLAITGGAAALQTTQIEAIEAVWWEDLLPECLWRFRVKDLGPLIVSIDAHGRNLHAEVQQRAAERLARMVGGRPA